MQLAVIGSRTFDDFDLMVTTLDKFPNPTIISGGARGADQLAARYARLRNAPLIEYLPDWNKHGKAAGFIRNQLIVDAADAVIAFWDGQSRGTAHSIDLARKARKRLLVVRFGDEATS